MYSSVPNCRTGFNSCFWKKAAQGCTLLRSSFKNTHPRRVFRGRGVSGTPATCKMGFFVTLVNGFFRQRTVSKDFGRFARKSVETFRSEKKPLTNDIKNPILHVAGVPDTPLPLKSFTNLTTASC